MRVRDVWLVSYLVRCLWLNHLLVWVTQALIACA